MVENNAALPPQLPKFRDDLYSALFASDKIAAERIFLQAAKEMTPLQCAESLFSPVLFRFGQEWDQGQVALAQLYVCGRICEEMITLLLPESTQVQEKPLRAGIAVLADYHGLGKQIVASFIRVAGYPLLDYGLGLDPTILAEKVRQDNLQALLVSTLMLPSALQVKQLSELLSDHPVKIFVGGAPYLFDKDLWQKVGADGMGANASSALALLDDLLEEMS